MKTMLLLAMLQVPQADTITATMQLPIPVTVIETQGDTTFVDVDVQVSTDSLAAVAERTWLAQQAVNDAIAGAPQERAGPPNWFWGGVLVVAAGAVLAYAFRDTEQTTIINRVEVEGSPGHTTETTETTTTSTSFPFCWPPGHCKRKRGGGDEE